MKKWVVLGVFAALVVAFTGSSATVQKGATMMPEEPIGELVIEKGLL